MVGFVRLLETHAWRLQPGGRYYVMRDDSSLIAFVVGTAPLAEHGVRLIGAHTDSPGLRLKPNAPHAADALLRLGVEVYGGPILATFTDRDLSLAGRVVLRDGRCQRVCFKQPLLRLPNLAIHLNRGVNEDGLKLNKQTELPLLLTALRDSLTPDQQFRQLLADELLCAADKILSWELAVYDTQPAALWGAQSEYIAAGRLDNLASCQAALTALINTAADNSAATRVCAWFDHEEVGSESAKGAAGTFLADVLERLSAALDLTRADYLQALSHSFCISADMAHAYQPNFPGVYEPQHLIRVNGGPVIKFNANQRYASDAVSAAYFAQLCEAVGVGYQSYAHRSDLACGSTIGPITAAGLGIRTVDVGNPLWAMHSIRESAGVGDHAALIRVLEQFFSPT